MQNTVCSELSHQWLQWIVSSMVAKRRYSHSILCFAWILLKENGSSANYYPASLVAQRLERLPAMQETRVWSLSRKIPWRRKWQPTPVFLPGESHGGSSLVGYSPWGPKELDTTERLHSLTHTLYRKEGKMFDSFLLSTSKRMS